MSSYPVLNNRPIDQWRVTDLKDELRKRKLPVKGLKEELVRRLFDSIQSEIEADEADEADEDVGVNVDDQLPDANASEENTVTVTEVHQETVVHVTQQVEVPTTKAGQESTISPTRRAPSVDVEEASADEEVPESVAEGNMSFEEVQVHTEITNEPVHEKTTDVDTNDTVVVNDAIDVNSDLAPAEVKFGATEASKIEEHDFPPAPVDALNSDAAGPMDTDVVTAATSDVGSMDTDVVTRAPVSDDEEKLELKVDLGNKVSMYDEDNNSSDTMNEDCKPIVSKPNNQVPETSLEDIDSTANVDSYKKDSPEGGSPEKLNLDRSSGDESMEEDVVEIKQDEANMKSDDLGQKNELNSEDVKEVILPDSVVEASKEVTAEEKSAASTEKRKLEDEDIANTEPIKRQRRWTADVAKVPERQALSQTGPETPKDIFQPAFKRSFGRSDSTASVDSPKERIVPPAEKPATTSLRIDRFVRPFTLKAVQELLGKTGSVQDFWMDHIKTHCYVTFSSVDEAMATRDAVYNLQWPPNNGNKLVAEFVDPQEVKLKVDPPPPPAAPVSPAAITRAPPLQQTQSVPRQAATPKEQLPPPPPPPLAKPPMADPAAIARERLPPTPKKPEPPVVTLDDLFRKTQSSPRIYYLPLSEEEVAAKLAAQGKGKKE
ncbi:Putative SAP DNA-binding domain family protein isoform 1 [Zea mays]|uniref:Putative SAP DNA-binding domain family protein isoform 1 n=1 Tax=Zea mays TaxID=4577 RepID=A0A1D6P7N7_MAIZE|nr:Putative SAP DNA-binding domain family protein isoform 1 [Zea mays]